MEALTLLAHGFAVLLTWKILALMMVGLVLGIFVGVLPGLGGPNGVAILPARSRDVPNVVAKGEFAVGLAVPSYMAFAEVLAGYDVMYVYPKNAYVTPEPMAVLKGAPHPKAAHAFIEFLLTEEGQKLFAGLGLYPITPKFKVQGPPGSNQEETVQFTAGIRSFYDIQVGNVYDDKIAGEKKRIEEDREEVRNAKDEIKEGDDQTVQENGNREGQFDPLLVGILSGVAQPVLDKVIEWQGHMDSPVE